MKHAIIATAAAMLIAGSAFTFSANAQGWSQGGPGGPPHGRMSAEDADARISALKTGLKLTPDQEKLWPQVENTLRDIAKERAARHAEARTARKDRSEDKKQARPDPITRLRTAAANMDATAGELRKLADASEPLYNTLDESQKKLLNAMIRENLKSMRPHREKRG